MNSYRKYVRDGALYCQDLFESSANFFLANTHVEKVIATSGHITAEDQEAIANFFGKAGAAASAALGSAREFSATHNEYPKQTVLIDFDTQYTRLDEIARNCEQIVDLVISLEVGEDLQEQIWAHDSFTSLFTATAVRLCDSVKWQVDSALATHEVG